MRTEIAGRLPAASGAGPQRHTLNGATMGTRYAATFYAAPGLDLAAIAAATQHSVDAVDLQMSTWKPDSDLMRLNRADVGAWVGVPEPLFSVIAAGLEIGRLSGGAFDIGMGDLMSAWGFDMRNGSPDPVRVERLAGARAPTHDRLALDVPGRRICKLAPVALDLSGIAKGFGVDRLAETLMDFGIADYLVSIDGEVRAGGRKPDGANWRVAVESPERDVRNVAGIVELVDAALATSGDYRHTVELGGRRHAHTMDPRTGRPLENGIAAVTVEATTCMVADAWATALLVVGQELGTRLARQAGLTALFALREAGTP